MYKFYFKKLKFSILIVICLIIRDIFCESGSSWNSWWAYEGISGPSYWGLVNPKFMLCNKGKNQSPIDIIPDQLLYDSNLIPLQITGNQINGIIENNGRGILIKIDSNQDDNQESKQFLLQQQTPVFNNGPLSYNYTLDHIVLHFGVENGHGSEHRISGQQFTGEIQLIGYNSQLYNNYSEAETSPNGLFALAFLIELCSYEHKKENIMLKKLIGTIRSLMDKEDENQMKVNFDLNTLISTDHFDQYLTYEGSLSQPPCSENVVWLIGNKPLYISAIQMQLLRNSASHGIGYNFRPIQEVYKRTVRTNIQFTNLKKSIDEKQYTCSMKQNYKYFINKHLFSLNNIKN